MTRDTGCVIPLVIVILCAALGTVLELLLRACAMFPVVSVASVLLAAPLALVGRLTGIVWVRMLVLLLAVTIPFAAPVVFCRC